MKVRQDCRRPRRRLCLPGQRTTPLPAGKIVLEFDLDVLKVPGDAGEKILAENIHLKIRGPEKICIIGKNGAGKTTLLRQMAQKLWGGKIWL